MANPFEVTPFNLFQALLYGQSGYDAAQKRGIEQQKMQAQQDAAQLWQTGNKQGALARLMQSGQYDAANAYGTIDQRAITNARNDRLDARAVENDRRTQANADRAYGLQARQFEENQDYTPDERQQMLVQAGIDPNSPEGRTFRLTGSYTDPNLPKVLPPGSSIVRGGSGEVIAKNGGGDAALLDEATIKAMAEQYRAGDTSVLQNLGRGAQGAENIVRLRKEVVRQNTEGGVSGAEQALRNAEMQGVKAGQRTIGTKGANIEMAATEFNQVIPVVQAASNAVSRTNYPDLNKIILAGQSRTGDPNVVKLGGGVNTLINLYARAISPSGTPTVSDKEHAREILSAAWSKGQFDAAVGMMQQEIKAALESPEMVRDEMRTRFLRGQGAAPVGYPAPGAAKPIVIDGYKITEH